MLPGNLLRLVAPLTVVVAACGAEVAPDSTSNTTTEEKQEFSSRDAVLLDFELDGELVTSSTFNLTQTIEDQLLYTIGHLNGNNSVGRLDRLQLSNITRSRQADGTTLVRYHAVLPVAWGSKTNLPTSYTFILPRRADFAGFNAFTDKYNETCIDIGAHDVDAGSMWYYYRPRASGCNLAEADVVRSSATISVSEENTTGKYPEYHKVWEDDALIVVSIFGKYEDGATTASDAGIAAYNSFIASMRSTFRTATLEPSDVPTSPGVAYPQISFRATLSGGRRLEVHALLVDNVREGGAAFEARYEELSTEADLIAYNGHAGLGANVRALARMGSFRPGKYQIIFMNGCDTFAYVDGALAETRARLNPDDPTGTKYMDIITNAMPSYFRANARNDMALINALLRVDAPMTFDGMFAGVDRVQIALVTGEEDNVYVPGYDPDGGGGGSWAGLDESATVVKDQELRFSTPELPAGTYKFDLTGAGDADLYVRTGVAPTLDAYDCRPYDGDSTESCTVQLTAPARIHVMVHGYAASSAIRLVATGQAGGGGSGPWAGLSDSGSVTRDQELRWQTPTLPEGRYQFRVTGTGDADLYVRIGGAPNLSAYNCRPYSSSSNEECTITLTAPAEIHVMLRGYAATSGYAITGARL